MRRGFMVLVATVLALPVWVGPVWGQQLSPLTGTTASPPGVSGPGVPPAVMPPAGPGAGRAGAGGTGRAPRMKFRERFDAANTTHDGKLTLDQARAGRMPQVVKHFDEIDAQHRGYVTMEDVRAYRKAMREQRKSQGGGVSGRP